MTPDLVKFTLGDRAEDVAGLQYYGDPDKTQGEWNEAFNRCRVVRKFGRHATQYEGVRADVEIVLKAVEGCPAADWSNFGCGPEDYPDTQAVRRAAKKIREALGK